MDDSRPASAEAAARLARAQRHALLFRRLIDRCGGYTRVMELGVTRLQRPTHLYRFGDGASGCFAPADVIEDLELFCGEAVYTSALADSLPSSRLTGDMLKETCEASVAVAELMRMVLVERDKPGGPSPRFRAAIMAAVEHAQSELRDVESAISEAAALRGAA